MNRIAFTVVLLLGLLAAPIALAQSETRTSASGGVTVKVTPKVLTASAANWEFTVVLDTHSQDLSDDLTKTAAIVAAGGERYLPIEWSGAPPGGHHRTGVLRFKAIQPPPGAIELQITRPGEPGPRSFRWQLQ